MFSSYSQLFQTELIYNALMVEIFKTHRTIEQANKRSTKNFWWHCNIYKSHVFVDTDVRAHGKALTGDGMTTGTLSG